MVIETEPNSRPSHKLLVLLLIVFPGLVLLLHSYLGSYTRLIADDFCSFYFSNRLGILRYVWNQYLNWGGRYSAFAVDSLIVDVGVNRLRYFPATLLVIWVGVATFTFSELLQSAGRKNRRPWLSLALAQSVTAVFAILSMSPLAPQNLYWWNGMRTYLPSLIVTTFYIGFFYWAQRNLKTRNAILLGSLTSFAIAFLDAGFNEPLCVVLFSFFIGLTAFRLLTRTLHTRDPLFYFLAAAILGTTLALAIMLLSPGTVIRRVFFPASPGIVRLFEITAQGYAGYLVDLFRSPKRLSALLVLVFSSIWVGTETDEKPFNRYWIALSPLGGIFLAFVSILPSVYGTSEMAHPRTLIVPTYLIVVSLIYAGLLTGKWLTGSLAASVPVRSGLMVCVAGFMLFSSWANATSLYESRATYISFAGRWDQANAQILQAKTNGEPSVTIPALHPWTGPGGDPTDNPRFWVNSCYSLYYGFPVLGPKPETGQP